MAENELPLDHRFTFWPGLHLLHYPQITYYQITLYHSHLTTSLSIYQTPTLASYSYLIMSGLLVMGDQLTILHNQTLENPMLILPSTYEHWHLLEEIIHSPF